VYGSRNSALRLRLPQFHATKADFQVSLLGFGASWVPPHSASIVSAGEKNLGGWWAFQRALLVPEKRIWEVGGRFNKFFITNWKLCHYDTLRWELNDIINSTLIAVHRNGR
jgi:hypothetical protein